MTPNKDHTNKVWLASYVHIACPNLITCTWQTMQKREKKQFSAGDFAAIPINRCMPPPTPRAGLRVEKNGAVPSVGLRSLLPLLIFKGTVHFFLFCFFAVRDFQGNFEYTQFWL